jgi:hypothetical protein
MSLFKTSLLKAANDQSCLYFFHTGSTIRDGFAAE